MQDRWLIIGLSIVLLAGALASMLTGTAGIGWRNMSDIWQLDGIAPLILVEIRLPRTLLAMAVGASLGFAGATMQGYVRNPLAEPGLLGVSGGASLGAALMFYVGYSGMVPVVACGMAGALGAVVIVRLLAGTAAKSETIVLAGIAVASMTGAGLALLMNLQPNPFALMDVYRWLMGSFADRTLWHVWVALPAMMMGMALVMMQRHSLSALALGEEVASSLGISLARARLHLEVGVALMVGAAVSVSGIIGFVGLMVPHLVRPLVQHDPVRLLIPSALGGAVLLLLADISVRLIPTNSQEINIGVITAMLGAPFFLMLILRLKRSVV